MTKLEEKLTAAVRKSLNLPHLKVSVRKSQRNWLFQLHHAGAASDWIELEADDIRVMKQLGLLPALHLGTFRVAYMTLRTAAEGKTFLLSAAAASRKSRRTPLHDPERLP